jgi:L-threonylcarbamoyladenylate synthase
MSRVCTIDESSLSEAKRVVGAGGLVVLPTDTVYGVACDPFNPRAVARVYAAKRRPLDKPLQVLLSTVDEVSRLGLNLPEPLERLSLTFLPGPFSPIAVAGQDSSLATLHEDRDGVRTQAVRVPDSDACRAILRATGPLACSSANRSGGQSPQNVQQALEAFGDDVDLYLDAGPTAGSVASTVVAADADEPGGVRVVREGVITVSEVRGALRGKVREPRA